MNPMTTRKNMNRNTRWTTSPLSLIHISAGIANLGDALLQSSSFHDLMGGKVEEIGNLYEHYGSLFEQAEHDIDVICPDKSCGTGH